MKNSLPAIATFALIFIALALVSQHQSEEVIENEASPETVVWQMAAAIESGRPSDYVDCFGGELKNRLGKSVTDIGEERFAAYLLKLHEDLVGISVSDMKSMTHESAECSVEFVFQSHNEIMKQHLKFDGDRWKIEGVEGIGRQMRLIPYGTEIGAPADR